MITVNGEALQCDETESLGTLMQQLGFSDKPCAVEVNQELVPHQHREDFALHHGDAIEIVTLVGGG